MTTPWFPSQEASQPSSTWAGVVGGGAPQPLTYAIPSASITAFAPSPAEKVSEHALAASYAVSAGMPTQTLKRISATPASGVTASLAAPTLSVAQPLSAYSQTVLADSPWGYWKLEDAGAPLSDSSGNAHSISIIGLTPTYQAHSLASGHAQSMGFNGSTHLEVTYDATLTGGSLTTEMWFRPTNLAAGTPRGGFTFNSEAAMLPRFSDAGLGFGQLQLRVNGLMSNTPTNTIPANNSSYHLVCVYNASAQTVSVYINGSLYGSYGGYASGGFSPGGSLLQILYDYTEGRDLAGLVSHIAVYKSALSAARVQAHYAAAGTVYADPNAKSAYTIQQNTDGAIYQWTLDQASGSNASVGLNTASFSWQSSSGHSSSGDHIFPASGLEQSTLFAGAVGGYAYYPTSEAFGASTYTCLVRPTSSVGVARKGVWDHGDASRYLVINADGSVGLKIDGTERTSSPGVISNGNPYHIVSTYDPTSGAVKCYVNNVAVINLTGTTGQSLNSNSYLRFTWVKPDGNELPANLSHMTLYQSVLSASQVANHYSLLTGVGASVTQVVPAASVTAFAPSPAEKVSEHALAASYAVSAGVPMQKLTQKLTIPAATTTATSGGATPYQGYASKILADAPLAYYPLQETSGTVAADASGHNRNGSYVNGAVPSDTTDAAAPAPLGNHARLDGTNDYIDLDSADNWLDVTNGFTAEGWFYVRSVANWQRFFVFATTAEANTDDIAMGRSGTTGSIFVNTNTGTNWVVSNAYPTLNSWHHVALTITNAGSAAVYIDGKQVGPTTAISVPTIVNRTMKWVGRSQYSADAYNPMSVTQVAVYGTPLSADRIQAHYNAGINAAPTPTPITSVIPAANVAAFAPKPAEAVTEHALYANVAESAVPPKVRTSVSIPAAGVAASIPAPSLKQAKITLIVPAANVRLSVSLGVQNVQIPAANVTVAASQNTVRRIGYVIPAARLTAKSFGARQTVPAVIVTAKAAPPTQLDHLTIKVNQTGSGSSAIASIVMTITPEFQVTILDDTITRAPTVITVAVNGGVAQTAATFALDGTDVWTQDMDSSGNMGATSLPVTPEIGGSKGTHTLTVRQTFNGAVLTASADYTLLRDPLNGPSAAGDDAQAISVPESVTPTGVRKFVIQDLVPVNLGGLGSFVFPINPSKMTSPHYEVTLKSRHTTSKDGQYHVFQAGHTPKEWTLSGYCATQDMADKLIAYRKLNRRLYIIDHHNRAWKCVITDVEFDHHLRQNYNGEETDWGLDYTLTAIVVDQDWVTPA